MEIVYVRTHNTVVVLAVWPGRVFSQKKTTTAVFVVQYISFPALAYIYYYYIHTYNNNMTPRVKAAAAAAAAFRSVNPLYLLHIARRCRIFRSVRACVCVKYALGVTGGRAGCSGGERRADLHSRKRDGDGDDSGQCRVVSPGSAAPRSPTTRSSSGSATARCHTAAASTRSAVVSVSLLASLLLVVLSRFR